MTLLTCEFESLHQYVEFVLEASVDGVHTHSSQLLTYTHIPHITSLVFTHHHTITHIHTSESGCSAFDYNRVRWMTVVHGSEEHHCSTAAVSLHESPPLNPKSHIPFVEQRKLLQQTTSKPLKQLSTLVLR
jgi:hypothetical protein